MDSSGGTAEPTAYSLPEPGYRADLTEVEKGTPMGELLRRYWHPVGLSEDATGTPKKVRLLGEDLILFRDGQGRPGLVYPRCCHRGTTLYYGKVEETGIRCCYHGWLFDVEGHCLDMPVEPNKGEGYRNRVRQPWYPVEERYGLIFAFMGPPERKPLLPRFNLLEELDDGEMLDTDDTGLGTGGLGIAPCNWLQHFENVMDPFHVTILHAAFSGTQFVPEMAIMPEVSFARYEYGMRSQQVRKLEDGRTLYRRTEALLPTLRVVPSPVLQPGRCASIGWTVPIDSTHYKLLTVARVTEKGELGKHRSKMNGKYWWDLTEEEHQKFPGDWEAQVGQGEISYHSEEHLAKSDEGIRMLRKFYEEQLKVIAEGGDPVGIAFEPGKEWIGSDAGNFFE